MATIDYELIKKARDGDNQSFTDLVKDYTPYVYRTAYSLLQDQGEAEDVSQEVFLKVHRSISQLRDVETFPSWLKKIITNSCLDKFKKRRPTPVEDYELEQIATPESIQNSDERMEIQVALKQLIPEYREALVLREWQGYNYQEIATILKIPLGTVKSRIHTARTLLRKILSI